MLLDRPLLEVSVEPWNIDRVCRQQLRGIRRGDDPKDFGKVRLFQRHTHEYVNVGEALTGIQKTVATESTDSIHTPRVAGMAPPGVERVRWNPPVVVSHEKEGLEDSLYQGRLYVALLSPVADLPAWGLAEW